MKQSVLVLGAGGFIGRRVMAALAAAPGVEAVPADLRTLPRDAWPHAMRLDATRQEQLGEAVDFADVVVNCVKGSPRTVVATARALAAVTRTSTHPARLVHISTMAVYKGASGTVDETRLGNGPDGAAAANIAAERLVQSVIGSVILRPGCVYGPGDAEHNRRLARWLGTGRLADLGPAGAGTCNLVFVDDVAAAVVEVVRRPALSGHVFNLGSPAPPSWNEYFARFAQALDSQVTQGSEPHALLARRLAEAGSPHVVMPWQRHPPLDALRSWSQVLRLDVRKAERFLRVAWTPLDTGLRATVEPLRLA